jgi:Tol biopolymer transport system component
VADADGAHPRRIAARGFSPHLSPDGKWVAYFGPRSADALYLAAVGGGTRRVLGHGVSVGVWAPDSSRLVVVGGRTAFLDDVSTRFGRVLVRGNVGSFDFSPDGQMVAFSRWNGAVGERYRSDIFAIRLATGRVTRLTGDGHSANPVWGPRWIAYKHFRPGGLVPIGVIWLMRPDGSGKRFLARGDETPGRAVYGLDTVAFSADGSRFLACAAHEFSCPPVALTVADGKRHKLAIHHGSGELVSTFGLSRDGRRVLADVGPFDGDAHHRSYAVPFGGGQPRLLARDAITPSWAR